MFLYRMFHWYWRLFSRAFCLTMAGDGLYRVIHIPYNPSYPKKTITLSRFMESGDVL
jgi:hypothetical protein